MMKRTWPALAFGIFLATVHLSCSGGSSTIGDSDGDASTSDAADAPRDDLDRSDGTDVLDATDPDTEPVIPDNDGDGHPADEDCDDADPEVIPGSIRLCMSACDCGTETCEDGGWTPCTATDPTTSWNIA